MEALKQCYAITNELVELLKGNSEVDTEKVNQLLDQRQACLTLLTPPTTETEKKLGQTLLQQDKELVALLQKEKQSIQKELRSLEHKKTSNQKYVNPYQALQTDGMFYDKRN
ncbi:flagellar protein FliT [Bacillus circulans]|uniref:flagellar protein FliT n=1 Tax=Niallia circulans TaxID=1397 RepID=UPI00155FD71E|nr:flagellar protein FliT [Niallia circulans]NRG27631.1 flagellar protein FliT [Niallia circulans]